MSDIQAFVHARKAFMSDADNLGAYFSFFSPLNILPKLRLGALYVASIDDRGLALVDAQRVCRVLPMGTPSEYYRTVLAALERYGNVSCVPGWVTTHLKEVYAVSVGAIEYMIPTVVSASMPGREHHHLRQDLSHARKLTTPVFPTPYSNLRWLNDLWYRQAKTHHHRVYDHDNIDWLLSNWEYVKSLVPDASISVITDTAISRPAAFCMGSTLTELYWNAYTLRYDRDAVRGSAALSHSYLAQSFTQLCENNGPADNSELKRIKRKQAQTSITGFSVRQK